MEKNFNQIVEELNEVLTTDQIQLLKDTINYGCWGDCEMFFQNGNKEEEDMCMGYCTNDAKRAGHFSGRQVSAMFRSIYSRLKMNQYKGEGWNEYFHHITDWWGDGSGDMFFIRSNDGEGGRRMYDKFEKWAQQ